MGFGSGLTPWVKWLLIANTIVFVVQNAVPWFTNLLVFIPQFTLVRPWTLITYMFAHGSFSHILLNMLGLFFFGPPLEERWGSKEFIVYYIICGLGGAILSFIFAFNAPIIGASAAVYGILIAFAMNWPNMPIYIWGIFPIQAKYLVAIFVAMSVFSAVGGRQDGVAHFAHLGGFAAGFLYLKLDYRASRLLDGFRKSRREAAKKRLSVLPGGAGDPPRPGTPARRVNDEELLTNLDRVLDKISKSGISSLTAEERRLLDDASRRNRSN